jgi:integral membrane sensor domain MASE1
MKKYFYITLTILFAVISFLLYDLLLYVSIHYLGVGSGVTLANIGIFIPLIIYYGYFMSKYHESNNTKMLIYLLMGMFHIGFLLIFRMIPNSKMAAEVLRLNISDN